MLNFYIKMFEIVFNALYQFIDYDRLAQVCIQNGEDPIYGYFILVWISIAILAIPTYLTIRFIYSFLKYLYVKEMQWRKLQARRQKREMYLNTYHLPRS